MTKPTISTGKPSAINQLTSLRGAAALVVFAFHAQNLIGGLFDRGYLGVDLFFILSGFILCHVYGNNLDLKKFFAARFARTYPLHIFTLALLLPALGSSSAMSRSTLVCNLAMVQAFCRPIGSWNGVSWSLSAEWLSYLLFPILLPLVKSSPRWIYITVITSCLVLIYVHPIALEKGSTEEILRRSLPEFLLGVCIYRAYLSKIAAHWIYFIGASACIILGSYVHVRDGAIIIWFVILILSAPYVDILRWRPLVTLGEISFSIYMTQFIISIATMHIMIDAGARSSGAVFIACLVATLFFATLTYRCIEVPAREILRSRLFLSAAIRAHEIPNRHRAAYPVVIAVNQRLGNGAAGHARDPGRHRGEV